MNTFIVECDRCRAKVAATETGRAHGTGHDDEFSEPWGKLVHVGFCPRCNQILVGEARQIGFEGYDSHEDEFGDVTRVYPRPPKSFSSTNIPEIVKNSLSEADKTMQANAYVAACAMLGRALEAICRDLLKPTDPDAKPKRIMLGQGINALREKKIIDDRLFEWSQQLQAFRNLAAHPDDGDISREDAEDLQSFVYAIVEYVYDLTERYEEFKLRVKERAERVAEREAKLKAKPAVGGGLQSG